jgi:hypothetical protein
MFEKSFITDCEGPLTLNDNAFEIAADFIEDGGELFKILSLYDDYLVDDMFAFLEGVATQPEGMSFEEVFNLFWESANRMHW